MGVFGFSGKDVRRVRKVLQTVERTPRASDDARPGSPPLRTGSTQAAAIFLTPAGGIPASSSAIKPGFTNCERWYRNKTKNEYEPSGTFATVYSRATTTTPANVLVTAINVDGDWEMAILICKAPVVTRNAGTPSTGTSPRPGTGPNTGGGGVLIKNFMSPANASRLSAASGRVGAGAAAGTTGGGPTGVGGGAGL